MSEDIKRLYDEFSKNECHCGKCTRFQYHLHKNDEFKELMEKQSADLVSGSKSDVELTAEYLGYLESHLREYVKDLGDEHIYIRSVYYLDRRGMNFMIESENYERLQRYKYEAVFNIDCIINLALKSYFEREEEFRKNLF